MTKLLLAGIALAAVLTACPTGTMTNTYKTTMNGANERPTAITTNGAGSVTATLDLNTKILTVAGTYEKLSGAVKAPGTLTSGAHIHGPATADATAGVLFDLTASESATAGTGTLAGTTRVLTDAEIADLNAGKWYVNVHTATNAAGEIRGQLAKQ
jgi:CHRD domain